tara:strand:+ start:477 stop:719 length:243 start_codon:yes stop_codon:yes gene_type:complete
MITIYSKPGCPYCEKIKRVMELEELQHVIYELNRDFTREEFRIKFGNNATFPQLTLDGIHLGGCQESIKHMRREKICCQV